MAATSAGVLQASPTSSSMAVPPDPAARVVTRAIHRLRGGDPDAEGEVWTLLYPSIRHRARALLRGDGLATSICPTEVVHQAYARLEAAALGACRDRGHALRLATRVMRRILVEEARGRARRQRPLGWSAARFEELSSGAPLDLDDRLDLALALERLAAVNPMQAEVVSLRHHAGLSCGEIATVLGTSTRTVQLAWFRARRWLRDALARRVDRGAASPVIPPGDGT